MTRNEQEARLKNNPTTRTALALAVAGTAFVLGRYVDHFSGTWNSWAAVIIASINLSAIICLLIRDFWRGTH
jgi:hypothetical protein